MFLHFTEIAFNRDALLNSYGVKTGAIIRAILNMQFRAVCSLKFTINVKVHLIENIRSTYWQDIEPMHELSGLHCSIPK